MQREAAGEGLDNRAVSRQDLGSRTQRKEPGPAMLREKEEAAVARARRRGAALGKGLFKPRD
jgi:hypothetical protein